MAVTFVNAGALLTSNGQNTLTPALPASRVNGNVLLSFYTGSNGNGTAVAGAGWVRLKGANTTGNLGVAWRIVDGTEAAPVWSTSGSNTAGDAIVMQYTGNAASPIGANGSGASPTMTTTGANSLAAYIQANVNSTAPGLATGFTSRSTNTSPGNGERLSDEAVAAAGTVVTPSVSANDTYLVELLAAVVATTKKTQGVIIW